MFTSVKTALFATATLAAAVPTSIVLVDRTPTAAQVAPSRSAPAVVEIQQNPAQAPTPPVVLSVVTTNVSAIDVHGRVAAGFELTEKSQIAATPPAPAPAQGPVTPSVAQSGVALDETRKPDPKPRVASIAEPEAQPTAGTPSQSLSEIRAMVVSEATAQNIPPKLALAVVQVASRYDARRQGEDGQIGLTQIRLRIAKQFGFKGSEEDLWEPRTNLKWGFKFLAGAYKRANGDTCKTIMKFTGGYYVEEPTKLHLAYCGKVQAAMDTP